MIHKIFEPKLDYFEIGIKIDRPIIFRESERPLYHIDYDFIKDILKFKDEHKSDYGFKELYVFAGKNWEVRSKSQKIIFKGEAFYSPKTWILIKMLVRKLDEFKVNWYLKRIDIRRNYTADSTIDPLQDIKNGFWIYRASFKSFFQPELYTRHSEKNLGTYFKSEYFNISSYDKSEQIGELDKKLNGKRVSDKNKTRYKKTIYSFRREHKDKNQKIKRFELKLLKKSKSNQFLPHLKAHNLEGEFCYSVLSSFYESHPMKKAKTESDNYKKFFEKGGDTNGRKNNPT
jgi:hypothetical protein